MDAGLFAQYVMNGLMLGMMYALVAVGFTLFFGVLDVIKFSHGDVLTVGAFTALATLMLGTVLRKAVRLFYPGGANPKPFPALLPGTAASFGHFTLRLDNTLMLAAGVIVIVGLQLMLQKTKRGRAGRGDCPHHGGEFHRRGAHDVRHRLGAGGLRRAHERAVL